MKKIYIQPTMLMVALQHQSHLMETSIHDAGGDAGIGYGGGGSGEGRVKESKSIWDEEW